MASTRVCPVLRVIARNAPLSVAVIGGMISSTILTLIVVPAGYSLVEEWRERRRGATVAGAAAPQGPQAPKRDG